jgi:hypothetical protein
MPVDVEAEKSLREENALGGSFVDAENGETS